LGEEGAQTLYIDPGSPWQNAYGESFHSRFRDECLNAELFANVAEAKVVIEQCAVTTTRSGRTAAWGI